MWFRKGKKYINLDTVKMIEEGPTGNAILLFIDGESLDLGIKFSEAEKLTGLHDEKRYPNS